ncbi:glycoside hydrolase family 127 protein [Leuconostoc gelidum]|uniref:glycoside hydrolase family 127 protein n=1 Tax=Leuconostoc gelidum TaxID=1244 RepID=UPI001CC7FDFF|nr:beta-L-arabinofuranosidase domain-containing protein [Leuconostoc gelidum]MBZ5992658.1 glycoside hydrolase family 127 protein [Leuconostoc gelidum subsp. gelidum]USP17416.1 glycoside hydrolase family 127 protein [Leuconostoc gelidum subsp. aenigmaticum]
MSNIELKKVEITSNFWNRYRKLIVDEVLPYQWQVMNDEANISIAEDPQNNGQDKKSHAIANLKIAAGDISGHHYGFPFQDTDVYKWLEAAAYSFSYTQNPDFKKITDEVVNLISKAQDSDGYLSTYFQIDAPERKFKRLQQSHELYSMGHYIEAGVAYFEQTGNEEALNIAKKMADCIDRNFGDENGKIPGYDGHPEIELALVRLFEVTNNDKYFKLAEYFINKRGTDPNFFQDQIAKDGESPQRDLIAGMRDFDLNYYLASEPIYKQKKPKGHAVRAVYLCTGMAKVARYNGNQSLLNVCNQFWNDIVKRQMYITGNIGQTATGEAFTYDYDLPNDTNYGETCASVGMVYFAKKMLDLQAKGEYADIIEKELFNGALSGMALDGKHFFYVNPLEANPDDSKNNPGKSHILTHRADWFGCACCPANLSRLITSLDQYLYTVTKDSILSHQFISNVATFENSIMINQTSNFPWNGNIHYSIVNPKKVKFRIGIRVPSWSADFSINVNGTVQKSRVIDGFIYFDVVDSTMSIDLTLDMEVKFMQSNNRVRSNFGKVAIQRGPLVYTAEEVDNGSKLWTQIIKKNAKVTVEFDSKLLGGVNVINIDSIKPILDDAESNLYHDMARSNILETTGILKLIPYYSWANRGNGEMSVWLNKQ